MTRGPHPVLTAEALAELYAHAKKDHPNECCGIVFGAKGGDVADRVKPCRNVQDDLHAEDPVMHPRTARMAYNLGTGDIFALQKSLRGDTPAKIVYHSHVDIADGLYFSDTDQAAATFDGEPAYPVDYVVIDVKRDGTHGCVQFAWDGDVKKYVEVRRYP